MIIKKERDDHETINNDDVSAITVITASLILFQCARGCCHGYFLLTEKG